jgi:hypothetical protein
MVQSTGARRGENSPDGLSDDEQLRKDRSYSPSIVRDTEELQEHAEDSPALDQDVDEDDVTVLPGAGGPDDAGDTRAPDADDT